MLVQGKNKNATGKGGDCKCFIAVCAEGLPEAKLFAEMYSRCDISKVVYCINIRFKMISSLIALAYICHFPNHA